MKILQVVHCFLPLNIGGTEVYTYNLSKEFIKQGHEVHVFTHHSNPEKPEYFVKEYNLDGIDVYSVNYNYKNVDAFEKTYNNTTIDGLFEDYIKEFKPDFIQFQHLTSLSVNLINVAKQNKFTAIATIPDYWYLCQRGQLLTNDLKVCSPIDFKNCVQCYIHQLRSFESERIQKLKEKTKFPLLRKIGKKIFKLLPSSNSEESKFQKIIEDRFKFIISTLNQLDLILAPSNFLRGIYIKYGIDPNKIVHSDYGFEKSRFEFKEFKKIEYPEKYGFIGTIIPPKGIHLVRYAFPDKSDTRAKFTVHGISYPYYNYENYYDDLKKSAKDKNISFPGEFKNSEVNKLLQELDILIVPSIWYENSPLTIHEAFLSGIPVITSDTGGMAELVKDGYSGFHFKFGDSESLKEVIDKILDNPQILLELNKNLKSATVKDTSEDVSEILNHISQIKKGR
ncbi:MAG: glycosyltransferase [bacterium]|nr:glycosyltransferase [bacterium]